MSKYLELFNKYDTDDYSFSARLDLMVFIMKVLEMEGVEVNG